MTAWPSAGRDRAHIGQLTTSQRFRVLTALPDVEGKGPYMSKITYGTSARRTERSLTIVHWVRVARGSDRTRDERLRDPEALTNQPTSRDCGEGGWRGRRDPASASPDRTAPSGSRALEVSIRSGLIVWLQDVGPDQELSAVVPRAGHRAGSQGGRPDHDVAGHAQPSSW